jgi:peroxiredoxin
MALKIGDKLASFRLKNVDGKVTDSADLSKGKKGSVIIFSCNHCPYVRAWEDRMIDLGRRYGSKEIAFAVINSNDAVKYPEDSYPEMVKRAAAKGYPFPYLHDEDQSVARSYGATRTPEVFLFDGQGMLRYHGRIDDNYEDPQKVRSHDLKGALEAVLAGKNAPVEETPPIGCTVKWK